MATSFIGERVSSFYLFLPGVSPFSLELVAAKAWIPDKWLTVLDRVIRGEGSQEDF